MGNFMLGQIYLKRLPKSIYTPTNEDLDNLEVVSEIHYSEETKPMIDYGSIDGCLSFWQAYSTEDGIELKEKSIMPSNKLSLHYDSLEELEKDFISLPDFLERAEFIGKKWRMPGTDKNSEFINSLGERTILYEYDNIMLVQNTHSFFGPTYEIMIRDPEAFLPDKCIGEVDDKVEEFKDKKGTYKKVLSFLSKNE